MDFTGFAWCCCSDTEVCPCIIEDDYTTDTISNYDIVGTFSIVSEQLSSTGEGTATQEAVAPTQLKSGGVMADVINNSHSNFGVVIGVGDDRIELLWDVANEQCILNVYIGGSISHTESYAGSPATSLELRMKGSNGAWNVEAYRDGVKVGEELAIAISFTGTSVDYGVISDEDGGTWDNLCIRSCENVGDCISQCDLDTFQDASSLDKYEKSGTFTVDPPKVVGSGKLYQKGLLPIKTCVVCVDASVVDDTKTAPYGVFIGNSEEISLKWNPDTSEYILDIDGAITTYPESPVASSHLISICISGNEGEWNIVAKADGVILDEKTSTLDFGADFVDMGLVGDGEWGDLCIKTCLRYCWSVCGNIPFPIAWELDAAGFGINPSYVPTASCNHNSDPNIIASECGFTESCPFFEGPWLLLSGDRLASTYVMSSEFPINGVWSHYFTGYGGSGCSACAVTSSMDGFPPPNSTYDWNLTGVPEVISQAPENPLLVEGEYPFFAGAVHQLRGDNEPLPVSSPCRTDESSSQVPIWCMTLELDGEPNAYLIKYTATARGFVCYAGQGDLFASAAVLQVAKYDSGWIPVDGATEADIVLPPATLNYLLGSQHTTGDGGDLCTVPPTITLSPMSAAEAMEKLLWNYCNEVQSPEGSPLGNPCSNFAGSCRQVYSELGLLALMGTIDGQEFRVCLSGPPGYSTGPFTGTLIANNFGWTGDCANTTIDVSFECRRLGVGEYAWALVLRDSSNPEGDAISVTLMDAPNISDVISGYVELCGTTVLVSTYLSDFTGMMSGENPFYDCCPSANIALFCNNPDRLLVDASITFPGHTCTITPHYYSLTQGDILCGGVPLTLPGWNPANGYFVGPFPLQGGTPDISRMVIYCGGSNIRYALIDSNNCLLDGAGATGDVVWDCESLTGYIQTPLSRSCSIGSYTIHLNGGSP